MKRMMRGHDGSVKFPTVAVPCVRRAEKFMKYTHKDTRHQGTSSPLRWVAALATLFALALLPTLCTFSTNACAAQAGETAATAKGREAKAKKPVKSAKAGSGKAKAQAGRDAKGQTSDKQVPRAHTWAFGAGQSASAWGNRGVGGDELFRNALPQDRKGSAGREEDRQTQPSRDTGGIRLSVDREDRRWEAAPEADLLRPDEHKAMESQHRVRAFATVKDENLSVGVGPEVIVRDENQPHNVFTRNNNQPEVDAGVGMRFKLDF